jgi:DNA-binding CsgD family transcriptional regulator
LHLQEAIDSNDKAKCCDLLLALGDALLPAGEPLRSAQDIAPRAFALAEVLDERQQASRACRIVLEGLRMYGARAAFGSATFRLWAERADAYAAPGTTDRVYADLDLARVRIAARERVKGRELATQALNLARRLGNSEVVCYPSGAIVGIGALWAPAVARDALRLAEEFESWGWEGVSAPTLAFFLWWFGTVFLTFGRREQAEVLWARLAGVSRRTSDPMSNILPRICSEIIQTLDGDLKGAVATGEEVKRLSDEQGSPILGRQFSSEAVVRPLVYLGLVEEAVTSRAGNDQIAGGGESVRESISRCLALAHLQRIDEARDLLASIMTRSDQTDIAEMSTGDLTQLLEAAVLLRELGAAAKLRTVLEGNADQLARPWTCVARHVGAAAALQGERVAARRYYQQALEVAGRVRFRPEVALTHLQLAELLIDDARGSADLDDLDFAIAEFREMNMQPASERALKCRESLSRRPAARGSEYPGSLTAREAEVLRPVAARHSNNEIAAELVLSVRTVERHISNIHGMTGAHGRHDLRDYAQRHRLFPPA